MGFDLVTWAAATADNLIKAGAVDYSSPPTLAEISARDGWNQVVALARRRAGMFNTAFGTSLTLPAYVTSGNKMLYTDVTDLRTKIAAVRAAEGFGVFTWTTTAVGQKISAAILTELQASLKIAGVQSMNVNAQLKYRQVFGDWLSPSGTTFSAGSTNHFGREYKGTGNSWNRFRDCWSFPVCDWYDATQCGTITYTINPSAINGAAGIKLYRSNTDDHAGASSIADNLNVLLTSDIPTAAGTRTLYITPSDLTARAGGWCSTVLGEAIELENTNPSPSTSNLGWQGGAVSLTFDWGS